MRIIYLPLYVILHLISISIPMYVIYIYDPLGQGKLLSPSYR